MKIYEEYVCVVCKRTILAESGSKQLNEWVQAKRLGSQLIETACPAHAKQLIAGRDGYPEESLEVAAKSLYLAARSETGEVAKKHLEAAEQSLAAAMRARREGARAEGGKKS